jgi:hypothetical protein
LIDFPSLTASLPNATALNNYLIPGAEKPLVVKFADTEEERTQRKQKQQRRRMGQVARYGHYIEGAPAAYAMPYAPQMPGGFPAPFAAPVSFFPFPAPYPHDAHAPISPAPVYAIPPGATTGAPPSGPSSIPPESNLFVYNLPENADDALLIRLFSPYGSVVSVRVQRDKLTHAPKGYGFVQMASPAEALAALQALNGAKLGDKILSVSFKK